VNPPLIGSSESLWWVTALRANPHYALRYGRDTRNKTSVMRGLDPRIHPSSQESSKWMDCRVKPGNDVRT
jgi:hypothetical protein